MNTSRKPVLEQYKLVPNNHIDTEFLYQHLHNFERLNDISVGAYTPSTSDEPDVLGDKHYSTFEGTIDTREIENIQSNFRHLQHLEYSPEIQSILESILTPDIDAAIKGYFKSNYAIFWFGFREVHRAEPDTDYSQQWHCDGAPKNHLKLITYIDDYECHNSSTMVMSKESTLKLKKIGYALNDIEDRKTDIADLLDHLGIQETPFELKGSAGSTLLFNPFELVHKVQPPAIGKVRRCFDLCILPSPATWQETISSGYIPKKGCHDFPSQAETLLKKLGYKIDKSLVLINQQSHSQGSSGLEHLVSSIFENKQFSQQIFEMLIPRIGSKRFSIKTILPFLKRSFADDLNWSNFFHEQDAINVHDLLSFEKNYIESETRYNVNNKPNPAGVFWPDPSHPTNPASKFEQLPFVNKHPIMDESTPIATAGSCFAFEIAKVLQQQGFNYVVAERADCPEDGVIIDGYKPGDKEALFSANYGILFNTPSLLQLAQKAFGTRKFTKYLVELNPSLFTDPYRENVFFESRQAYLQDYPKHIEAIKQSLQEAEVFIFTAGLNECWQLLDGTVISRNPKSGFNHLLTHKTLTVQENVNNIKQFYHLVKQYNPKFKLVLTLSPIPLLATGRGNSHHVIEANTHSKAVLRVALEQAVNELEDAYYLPSYELVTECSESPWESDHRHVTRETVDRVINMFKEMFVKERAN